MRGLTQRFLVQHDHVLHLGGGASAVVRSGAMDLDALDPARRAAALAAFTRLCDTLEEPLQLLVRIRRISPVGLGEGSHPLRTAMQAHHEQRLRTTNAHRSEVLLITHGATRTSCMAAVHRVEATLRAMAVEATLLSGEGLRSVVCDPLPSQAWHEQWQHVGIGATRSAGFAMRTLPGHPVTAGWLRPLFTVQCECDISILLAPAPLGIALRSLGRRLRDLSAHRMLESERGAVGDVHVDIGMDAAHSLRARLARRHGRALHLSLAAVVTAERPEQLASARQHVQSALHAALVGSEPLHFRNHRARLSTLPLGLDAIGTSKLVDSTAAATCVPWVDARCDDPGGYRLGEGRVTHSPVLLAPFDPTRHRNANIAVFATSGHGKSFALGTLVMEAALHGVDSVILDPEGEYRGVVDAFDGSYVNMSPGSDAAVNIFETSGDDDEAAVAAVTDLLSVLAGRLGDVDRAHADAAARDALLRARLAGRRALLEDCLPSLQQSAQHIAVVVRRYCSGALGMLFNRPTTVRIDDGVCAISLRDMPSEHMAAATLMLGRFLWALVQQRRRRRHIVVDEAGALCVHPALRSLLVQLARRCRKYGSSLVVATQNAQDLLGSDEGTVVATNCAIVLLGGQRPADTSRMAHAFGLTASQQRFLETAARGEFLLLAGDNRLEMMVDVPAEYSEVLRKPEAVPAV